jgi:hypothetical protein
MRMGKPGANFIKNISLFFWYNACNNTLEVREGAEQTAPPHGDVLNLNRKY